MKVGASSARKMTLTAKEYKNGPAWLELGKTSREKQPKHLDLFFAEGLLLFRSSLPIDRAMRVVWRILHTLPSRGAIEGLSQD